MFRFFQSNNPWNYDELCANPNMNLYKIMHLTNNAYVFDTPLFRNTNIHATDVINIQILTNECNWQAVMNSTQLDINHIKWILDMGNSNIYWGAFGLSSNYRLSNKTLKLLLSTYSKMPWDYNSLSMHPNMSMDIVLKYKDKPWDWAWLSFNINIQYSDIQAHPELPWNYTWVSQNPNIGISQVLENIEIPWDWNRLCAGAMLTLNDIKSQLKKNPKLNFSMRMLMGNKHFSPSDIYDLYVEFDIPVWWIKLAMNPKLTSQDVLKFSNIEGVSWDWWLVFKNPSLHLSDLIEIYQKHPDKPWDWRGLSMNPNLSIADITGETFLKHNIHFEIKWDWNELSRNLFLGQARLEINKWISMHRRRYFRKHVSQAMNTTQHNIYAHHVISYI
uniref:Uncharacterized protein n=1 Tax=Megaviridae environmental sample TaxID=1737588 RepID=A0A5J6VIL7_9VIRU|nr:MAG: hypothetical protein [Megaviridae environmental sample]